jgi:hypothetical protein
MSKKIKQQEPVTQSVKEQERRNWIMDEAAGLMKEGCNEALATAKSNWEAKETVKVVPLKSPEAKKRVRKPKKMSLYVWEGFRPDSAFSAAFVLAPSLRRAKGLLKKKNETAYHYITNSEVIPEKHGPGSVVVVWSI